MVKIVAVSGVDGSGKTSIIKGLQTHFIETGQSSRYVWLRYNHYLTKFLLAFSKFSGITKYEYFEGGRVVYHPFHRHKLVAFLFVTLTWIDTFFASLVLVRIPSLFSDKVIICDRWVYDIMVDLEVDTKFNFSQESFLNKLFKWLQPKSTMCFVVTRDLDATKGTREESVHDRNFQLRYQHYQRHGKDPNLNVIDNNGTISTSIQTIIGALDGALTNQNPR